jgi:hypothetical protein
MSTRTTRLVALTILLTARAAAAQTNGGTGHAHAEILPGSTQVDGSLIPSGRFQRRLIRVSAGSEQELGRMTQEISRIEVGGRPALRSVLLVNTPRGEGADTSILRLPDLTPITHRSGNPQRTLLLDFDGTAVHASMRPASGEAQSVHHQTPVPTFDSAIMDLVISALTLRSGFAARIPFYIFEKGGLAWLDISVTGQADLDLGGRHVPVWEVTTRFENNEVRYAIDRATREVVRTTFTSPDGSEMRIQN